MISYSARSAFPNATPPTLRNLRELALNLWPSISGLRGDLSLNVGAIGNSGFNHDFESTPDPRRLSLSPLTPADLELVFQVFSDPDTWQHLPVGRHKTREESRTIIGASMSSMREHKIGQWAVRVADQGADDALAAGTFIGTGGVNMTPALVWNLGYRLSPAAWGRGFATEIALAAVAGARIHNDSVPITARVLSNNPASARVAVRAGLRKVWRGPTTTGAAAGFSREIFSDRDLGHDALRRLIEAG